MDEVLRRPGIILDLLFPAVDKARLDQFRIRGGNRLRSQPFSRRFAFLRFLSVFRFFSGTCFGCVARFVIPVRFLCRGIRRIRILAVRQRGCRQLNRLFFLPAGFICRCLSLIPVR